jgi:hypothetical protein
MNYKEISLTDIIGWIIKRQFNTGGTREKFFCQNPESNVEYFFKQSMFKEGKDGKEGKDYKFEFWSEVIASKLGQSLGFEMVDYNVAIYENKIGCLCPSMLKTDSFENLEEGVNYLIAKNRNLIPELNQDKKASKFYTFDLIEQAFEFHKFNEHLPKIIELIIFDTIISNGDRHQENWGFIVKKSLREIEIDFDDFKKGTIQVAKILYQHNENVVQTIKATYYLLEILGVVLYIRIRYLFNKVFLSYFPLQKIQYDNFLKSRYGKYLKPRKKQDTELLTLFSPIYDSGSSLGRELSEEKIASMLKNRNQLNSYIDKGVSEIRWEEGNKKISFFELVEKLLSKYPNETTTFITKVLDNYDKKQVDEMIQLVDKDVPDEFSEYKLSDLRKQFISKLIDLRINKLQQTFKNYANSKDIS